MKKIIKEFCAEFIAAFMLIVIGCGTAMATGAAVEESCGYVCVALAFGLAIFAIAYSVGNISGGHANPAVSLGVLINGGITPIQFVYYVVAQVLGAMAGSAVLVGIYDGFSCDDMTFSYATNAPADVMNPSLFIIIVECVATFIFVMTVLGATSKKHPHGEAGLAIAGCLAGIHLVTISLTGAAINPARFLGPALTTSLMGVGDAMTYAPAYIFGPLLGGLLAGVIYRLLESDDEKAEKKEEEKEEKTDEVKIGTVEEIEKDSEEEKESDGEMTKSLFESEFGEEKSEEAEEEKTEE